METTFCHKMEQVRYFAWLQNKPPLKIKQFIKLHLFCPPPSTPWREATIKDEGGKLSPPLSFREAFDMVDHEILLQKLRFYDLRNAALKWFTSYLFHQKQICKIESAVSSSSSIECGVPQGPNLGPIIPIVRQRSPKLFKALKRSRTQSITWLRVLMTINGSQQTN